jgi:hypothetical protein
MRHFNYYPNGGVAPSVCALCGITRDHWDTGAEHYTGGSFLICTGCVGELAENIGWVPKAPVFEKIENLEAEVEKLTAELQTIPNLIEGFIANVRSNLTDFVLAVSNSHSSSSSKVSESSEGNQPATDKRTKAYRESVSQQGSHGVSADADRYGNSPTNKQ